jgi:hypothetical protein
MKPLPIACSLSPQDQAQRLREMAALSERLLGADEDGRDAIVRFRADGKTRKRLAEVVESERDCCPFLDLSLSDRGSELLLSIRGPEGAEPVIGEIVAAFTRG